MKQTVLKVKDFTRFNREFLAPMKEVRAILSQKHLEVEDTLHCNGIMETVCNSIDKLQRQMEDVWLSDLKLIDEILNEEGTADDSGDCQTKIFPGKLPESELEYELLSHFSAIQYFNYIVSRGDWTIHWFMMTYKD